jgi:dipeptidyl aminopeptidase/acylaminoacyl peptidase
MAARLAESGVKHELISVTEAGHGLSGAKPDKVAQIAQQAAEFVKTHTG